MTERFTRSYLEEVIPWPCFQDEIRVRSTDGSEVTVFEPGFCPLQHTEHFENIDPTLLLPLFPEQADS